MLGADCLCILIAAFFAESRRKVRKVMWRARLREKKNCAHEPRHFGGNDMDLMAVCIVRVIDFYGIFHLLWLQCKSETSTKPPIRVDHSWWELGVFQIGRGIIHSASRADTVHVCNFIMISNVNYGYGLVSFRNVGEQLDLIGL